MMKKLIISITILIIIIYDIFPQSLENYSGKFNFDLFLQPGKTEYQYKVIDNKNVKNGTFSATFEGTGNFASCKTSVIGNYTDDLKTGKWVHSFSAEEWFTNNKFYTATADLTANYSAGLPSGKWTLNYEIESKRNKNGDLEMESSGEFKAQFSDGIFINDFYLKKSETRSGLEYEIDAEFDEYGFVENLNINDKGVITKETYVKGIKENEFFDDNSEKLKKYEKFVKNYPDSLDFLDFKIDTLIVKSIEFIINDYFAYASSFVALNELDAGDKFYNGKFNSFNSKANSKLTYEGFYYLEFLPCVPKNILPIVDSINKKSNKTIREINENLGNSRISNSEDLEEIVNEFNLLKEEIINFQKLNNDAVAFYSGKTNTKQSDLLDFEAENKEYSFKIIEIIYEKLLDKITEIDELKTKLQSSSFDVYYENAIEYYNNMDYTNCVSYSEFALKIARTNPDLELDTTAVCLIKDKADIQKNLQEKFNELTKSLQNIEILFKAPPRKDEEIGFIQKLIVEDTYGENYYRFDREYTLRNYLQNKTFPTDTISLEYLFINNFEKEAEVWNKEIKNIYKSYVIIVEDYRVILTSETNTDKRTDVTNNLNYLLMKYEEILESEDIDLKEYNKKFKSAGTDIDLIKQVLGIETGSF